MKKTQLAYEELSESGKFREQFRFVFAIGVIATIFVMPNTNALEAFAKLAVGFSALFAALFLIATAVRLRYYNQEWTFEIFRVNERFRMKMFDYSVDVFAAAFLMLIGILIVGWLDSLPGVELEQVSTFTAIGVMMTMVGVIIVLSIRLYNFLVPKRRKKLPKI